MAARMAGASGAEASAPGRRTAARSRAALVAASVGTIALTAACGDDPMRVEYQVIEETEFAASLNIDLSQMTRTGNGIYRLDVVVGTGDTLVFGTTAEVDHTGWLSDGTQFSSGVFSFVLGAEDVIRGFEDGVVGMLEGGTRLIIIPPELAYAGQARRDDQGNVIIPPGSILVFEVVLQTVS